MYKLQYGRNKLHEQSTNHTTCYTSRDYEKGGTHQQTIEGNLIRVNVFICYFSINTIRLPFLRATACNAIARLCYGRGVRLSVCLSVTLLYCVKTTQLKIMKSSLYDSPESLVSN